MARVASPCSTRANPSQPSVSARMSVAELEAGLRWLFSETYSGPETEARLQSFVAQRRDARWARHAATARAGGAPAPADGPAP
jgi:hypothetical protein